MRSHMPCLNILSWVLSCCALADFMALSAGEWRMARSIRVFENSRAFSCVICTTRKSPGSLTTACATHESKRPSVLPVRAGPTKHTASCPRLASMFMGSTMYGVASADHGPMYPPG